MHLDHLSFAAGPEGLDATARRLGELLGTAFREGGFHPRFGTRNKILPLTDGQYLEVVEVLDHPAADKAPFGQAVRARSADGGGWLGWVVAVDDLGPVEERLGRAPVDGQRYLPDGTRLYWQQLGVKGLQSDPQLPFFVHWLSDASIHPSHGGHEVELLKIEIAGDRERVDDWLGGRSDTILHDVDIDWIAPNGQPGLSAAVFSTPRGEVRL
ncbi:VOC family protein [uncultured Friedmanniella sp.]|uniref:VOC family protein n=1 Tax=uncultured Friedmanniella sp. TaxID=335381 RepID=UPI0035CAAD6A